MTIFPQHPIPFGGLMVLLFAALFAVGFTIMSVLLVNGYVISATVVALIELAISTYLFAHWIPSYLHRNLLGYNEVVGLSREGSTFREFTPYGDERVVFGRGTAIVARVSGWLGFSGAVGAEATLFVRGDNEYHDLLVEVDFEPPKEPNGFKRTIAAVRVMVEGEWQRIDPTRMLELCEEAYHKLHGTFADNFELALKAARVEQGRQREVPAAS